MTRKLVALTFAALLALGTVASALADKGGVPNANSCNGAAHANANNDNSAHVGQSC